ncbi:MAG: hypothetical protein IT440_14575 [Phycisphaeraceae bacterium]|nr:hypothetical protein [Phycisphaeraceae bacterium]
MSESVKQFKGQAVGISGGAEAGKEGTWTCSAGTLPKLTQCRARLVWRFAGEEAWRNDVLALPKVAGESFQFELRSPAARITIEGRQDSSLGVEFAGRLKNTSGKPIELLRFHYLDGKVENAESVAMLLLLAQDGLQGCVRLGKESTPIRDPNEDQKYWWALPQMKLRLPDPIHDEANWSCGLDSAVLFTTPVSPGWVIGATGPGKAFGEFGYRTAGPDAGHFYAGQLLDNILLPAGKTRELERILLVAGDWQEGLRHWSGTCAKALGPARTQPPMAGFCSWYRNFAQFTKEDIDKCVDEFAEMPVPPGGRQILIDDGYQKMPGDWSINDRYPADWWKQLPHRIAAGGSIPALWLAPQAVFDTHPAVQQHPEWFQRLPDGSFAWSLMNWGWCDNDKWMFAAPGGTVARNLEVEHPGARQFVIDLLRKLVADGWQAVKLDFTGYVPNRQAYDRSMTTFESYRNMWSVFREAVGPDVLVNACIGAPWRYSVGLVDSARIGGDMVGDWSTMRHLLPMLLVRMLTTNGIWWSADPDVFYMRRVNSIITGTYFDQVPLSTSPEEQSLLLTAIGMMGGMMYTSDLPSEWTEETRKQVRAYWNEKQPMPAKNPRLVLDEESFLPRACRVDAGTKREPMIQVALFNWSDEEATVTASATELGLDDAAAWKRQKADKGVTWKGQKLSSKQPPHSARVAWLVRG